MTKIAVIIGSSGLTGSQLLKTLLSSNVYHKVISFVRRSSKISHPKLVQYVVDFDNPQSYENLIEGNDMFCCLGTTIKKAGTEEAFEKVDLHYPIQFAKAAANKGIKQFSIISTLGANPKSGNFYLRTKGKCEDELRKLPFQSISIFRPSLLLGNRKEFRLGEKLAEYAMRILSVFLVGSLRKYRSISIKKVAYAMFQIAQQNTVGYHVYESDEISDMSAQREN
ncbi:oxidoreductase [Dysgonomonas sp. Marseille-P4677]|uniref:oxidoreductase n=1 Tax=Dysgonomonas sp. Marseille-P4677 TaxID=2364790 RepID=UPI001913BA0D|nr:oxidoreductase [Dysgonomonas sp. Marseille-P4677]MBK5721732.1 oxidoreductase [Dysgonomonas sp. Marseille-P4677]